MWLPKPLTLAVLGLASLLTVAGCGRSAFWSPDSSTVATDLDGKLRTFDVRTSTFTPVDTGGRYVVNPAFSPDGQQLAYYGITHADGRAESCDVWVKSFHGAAGSGRRLAALVAPADQQGPLDLAVKIKPLLLLAWSPDGRKLAYSRVSNGHSTLEIRDLPSGETTSLGRKGELQFMPAWSPDGTRLAYLAHAALVGDDMNQPFSVYLADLAAKEQSCLRDANEPRTLWPYWPLTWSQDGASVVILQQSANERQFEVRAIPTSGGTSELITQLDSPLGSITPDLAAVVYMGGKDRNSVIYKHAPFTEERILDRVEPSGKVEPVPLSIPAPAPYPVLSADGKRVALPLLTHRELRLYNLDAGSTSIHRIR